MGDEKLRRTYSEIEQMAGVICEQLGGVRNEWHDYAGIEETIHSYHDRNLDISLIAPYDEFKIRYKGTLVFSRSTRRQGAWKQQYELLYKRAHARLTHRNKKLKREAGMYAWALPIYGSLPTPLGSKEEQNK